MKDIAIVDIETSGFQNQGGLIVEIGVVWFKFRNR